MTDTAQAPRKSFKFRIVVWIAGTILALLVLLLVAIHTPVARRYALKQTIQILGDQGVAFDASGIDYNLFNLTATLNNVTVRSKTAPDLPALAHADRIYVDLSLRKLVSGGFHVQDGSLRNPVIHLVLDKDGRDNIPKPPPKAQQTESKTDWFIDKFLVEGGSIRVEDRRQQLDASMPLSQVSIDGNPATNNHDIQLATQPGKIAFENRTLALGSITADLQLQENALEVRSAKLGVGESTVAVSGKLNNFDNPQYDFEANTRLDLSSLTKFAGLKQRVEGTVSAALTAQGPINQLKATVRLDGENLAVEGFENLDLKAQAGYDAAAQHVTLDSLNLVSPAGTIQGKGNVALNEQAGNSNLQASVRGLDLQAISRTLKLPVRIASRATADIDARWPGLKYEQAAGGATMRFAATRNTPAQDVIPLSGTINAKASGDRIVVGIPSLSALEASASGQVTLIDRQRLGGNVQVSAGNLSNTISLAEAFLGRKPGTLVGTNIGGSAVVDAQLGGTVQNPSALANLNSPGLQVGTLEGITLGATADYNAARVDLRSATIGWQGQQLTASGTVGLKGQAPAVNLQATSSTLSIPTLLAAAGKGDIPASGTLQFDAVVTGTTKAPQATVNLSGAGLAAYGETFGTLSTRAEFANDVLTVDGLRLDKPQEGGNGSLEARATYNIETKDYTVAAKADNLRLTSMTLPGDKPVRAEIEIQAEGAGNINNPALNAKLEANDVVYDGTSYGSATVSANVANQRADIQAAVPKFNLSAKANVGTNEPYPSTFEIVADNTNLATLPIKMEKPLEGTVAATVRGTADLKNPESAQVRIEASQANLNWNGQPIRTDGPLLVTYQNKTLIIERAAVVALDSRISIDGKLPLDATAGEGAINIASTLHLPSLVSYVPSSQPITAQGTATINGVITGTLKRIDPQLKIGVENGYVSTPSLNPPLSNINLAAEVTNGALEIQRASFDIGPAIVTASGQVPFALLPADLPVELPRRQGPARLTAELQNLSLETIQGLPETLAGVVSAKVEAQADRPEIEAVSAKLTFPQLQVSLGSYGLEQQGISTITVEKGIASIDQFQFTGPETKIQLSGTAGLVGAKPLDVKLSGTANAAIVSAFTDAVRAQGPVEVQLAASGTVNQPSVNGFVQLSDAEISLEDPRVGLQGLNARIELAGNRANLTRLNGTLNGGTLTGGGGLTYQNGELRDTNLSIKAEDVYLDYPTGLRTVSDVAIQFRSTPDNLILGGEVVIEDGGFTDDLNLDTGVLAALTGPRRVELTEQRNEIVENIRFDLGIRTAAPLIIDNNLAEAEIEANLRLLGNPYQPGLSGRLSILEGGVIRLNEREYIVDRGEITFTNERKIEPNLDILANTRAGDFDITLGVTGVPGNTETTLTSDPPLPEPDIMAVLLTGKSLDDMRGQEFEVARNQVLSYLTGRVGSSIGSRIAGATGLSTVRIEPNLIANEANPSARLTVGQDITRNLELIYSMNLTNSSDQIYVAEYDISKRFSTRGIRQQDGSFRMDFRHDLRFGGVPEPRRGDRRKQLIVDNLSILGNDYFTEKQIADKLDLEEGKKYDFFKARKGVDRIEKMFRKQGLLESDVRLTRTVEGEQVDLQLQVKPGPVVDFVWEGFNPGGDLQKRVREIWQGGVFDRQRGEDAIQAIHEALVKEDYLQPELKYSITTPTPESKRVLFDIATGPKFNDVEIVFDGAKGIKPEILREIVEGQKLTTEVYVKPGRVTELLTRFYAEEGYLTATVSDPRYELNGNTGTGRVVFPVNEGPLFKITSVEFNGNTVYDDEKLLKTVPLPKGEAYRPVLRERSLQALQELYWNSGYNDVDTSMATRLDKEAGTIGIVVNIAENRKSIVKDIVIEGNDNTSRNLINTQLVLNEGEPLNLQKLSESRRNLYNTGAYSVVDILREEIGEPSEPDATADPLDAPQAPAAARPDKQVRLTVRVREVQPFSVRYGGSFDTERGPGVIADFENRNSLGSARNLGLRTRYDSQLQEARLYFSQPLLRRFPVKTIISPYYRREQNPGTVESAGFDVDRIGFSAQQETRFRDVYLFNYGYRIEQSKTTIVSEIPLPSTPIRIAALIATLTRETRDDVLDASRGSLFSQALEYSPAFIGSQSRFVRYFGQYFKYIPLEEPKVEIFTNKVERPRFVYAGAVRLGLSRGFSGQEVPLSERFLAGGSNTLRAFEQNSVGPVFFDNTPIGGDAMLIINNEIRHPLFSIFDAVGFLDIGNVYRRASDISLTDLRKSAGVGLRVRTPWVLLRLDYGFKLDRREGEPASRLFFSIGQAF